MVSEFKLASLRRTLEMAGGISDSTRRRTPDFPQPIVLSRTRRGKPARIAFVETWGVSTDLDERRRAAVRDFSHMYAELLHDELAAAGLDEREGAATMMAIVGGMQELATDWMFSDPRSSVDELATLVESTVRRLFPHRPG